MKQEFPTAYAAASRVPLYPSDARSWDVHGGAVVSPTMHLLPVAKRLEDMVGRLYVDFVRKADDNYAALLDRSVRLKAEFSNDLAEFTAAVEARLKSVEDVVDGKLRDELDPVFTRWLAGRTFVEAETDPVFTAWLSGTTLAPPDAQPNVIEKIKVNGEALTVNPADKSVNVVVSTPDTYTKDETDTMLATKADEFTEWEFSGKPDRIDTIIYADEFGIKAWWGVENGVVTGEFGGSNGDADATEVHMFSPGESFTATRRRVLRTGDAGPNVIETVKVNGEALEIDSSKAVDIDLSRKADAEYNALWNVKGLPDDPPRMKELAIWKNGNAYCVATVLSGVPPVPVDLPYGTVDLVPLQVYVEFVKTEIFGQKVEPTYTLNVYEDGTTEPRRLLTSVSTDSPADQYYYRSVEESISSARTEILKAAANVIETVKVNGEALAVDPADKSVNVSVPDAYTKSESDTMLAAKADRYEYSDWSIDDAVVAGGLVGQPSYNGMNGWTWARSGGGFLVATGAADALSLTFRLPGQSGVSVATRTRTDKVAGLADRVASVESAVGSVQAAVTAAQSTATSAQSTATSAQSTATSAQSTADSAVNMAKYPVVQKSGTTVMLEDRKVNVYSGTLSSDVTLVLPPANADGRVRDLEFRANVTGLRLVGVRRTDASGAAVALFSMSPESAPAEEGVNAWYFTETGGEVRMERALLKPAGYQVKMDFTCANTESYYNVVDFLDSAGETIKSIKFKDQTLSEIVSGVSSLRIGMSDYGHVVMNGTTYDWSRDEDPRIIVLAGDSVITSSWADECLAPDTPILTPSGPVALKDVRAGDVVIGVDHRGVLRTVKVTRCDTHLEKWAGAHDRWAFRREDGEKVVVTTVNRHRFYNVERGAMVYMDEWSIGEHGRDSNGCDLELVSHEHVDEPTRHMTLFTETQTYFADGLLSGNRHTPHIDWEDR